MRAQVRSLYCAGRLAVDGTAGHTSGHKWHTGVPQAAARYLSEIPHGEYPYRKGTNVPQTTSSSQPATEEWTAVQHEATGQLYYWNKRTGETTALGEPKPGPEGRQPFMDAQAQPTLLSYVGWGLGIGCAFAIMGKLLGG